VISEAAFFAIVFQGNSRPASAGQNQTLCRVHSIASRFIALARIALPVMRTVPRKNTGMEKHDTRSTVQQRNNRTSKKKSPAEPGFFDEYLFQSVHFASLAI
jgi:hypothetical protein